MILLALGLAAASYLWGVHRIARAGRRFSMHATIFFALGLAVAAVALVGPLDSLADASLAWHMVQHLALLMVAAPLLLLGAPIRLALASLNASAAGKLAAILISPPLRVLAHPAVAWLQFTAVLYAAHFTPLYELALEHPPVHAFEHMLFLTSALLFWTPLLAVAPAPHAPSHPVRLLAIFLALPMSAFLGFALYVSRHVLYAHYAPHANALDDQMNAGAVMWLAGGTPLFVTLLWIVADWGALERRFATICDQ